MDLLGADRSWRDLSMTVQAETHASESQHSSHAESADPRLEAAKALHFEVSELHDFEMADKAAGQMMGKLLAFLFCVLLFLMTGVNIWMVGRDATGKDPQAPITSTKSGHGSEATHH
jgi:hypothetical protein